MLTFLSQLAQQASPSNVFVVLSISCSFILALVLAFCFHQWKLAKIYKQYPSVRIDFKILSGLLLGRYPRTVSLTSVVFSAIVKEVKRFQAEGVCILWFFRPCLFIFSEEFTKVLYNEQAVINKSCMFALTREIFGNGILTSGGEMWKAHRKFLNPAFFYGVLKGKMSIFNKNAVDLVQKLQSVEGQPIENITQYLKNCSFKIMTESVLGFNLNDEKYRLKAQNFMKMLVKGTQLAFKRLPLPWLHWNSMLPFFRMGREYLEAVNEIHRFTHEVIEEVQKSVTVPKPEEPDADSETEVQKSLAEILFEQHLRNPSFTLQHVRDHLSNIIPAGYDSITVGLMWCMYSLGHHPEVQEKVYKEIQSIVPAGDVTSDDLWKLKYLDCVIKETLRLYPPVPIYSRKADREIQCGKYAIPKGCEVIFCPFLLHRNPNVFPLPEKFDPERFAEASNTRPWMHMPFAEGYRNCIGKKFAMMEMKVLLVHVLRRLRITTLNKLEDNELDWAMVLKPTKRFRLLFTVRNKP